jgi:hypothetical protein
MITAGSFGKEDKAGGLVVVERLRVDLENL